MSPFVIFAISLTIAYVIYYAVMITRDLYGKKEENKSNEEVFDVSNITEEEAAVAVNESDGGFSIANKQYDTSYQNETTGDDGYGNGIAGSGSLGSGSGGNGSVGYGTVGNEAGRNGIAGSGSGGSGVIGNGTGGSGIAGGGAGGSGYGSEGNEGDGSNHAGNNDSGVGAGGMSSDNDNDDANQQKKTAAESLQERVSDQMESTSPIWINGLWQNEFTESLLRQGETKPGQPNIKTIPIKDEI